MDLISNAFHKYLDSFINSKHRDDAMNNLDLTIIVRDIFLTLACFICFLNIKGMFKSFVIIVFFS